MAEASFPQDETLRLEALAACRILDSAPEPAFDELAALAARLLSMPIALVSLVDAKRQWFKARIGVDVTETSRKVAFCAHAILEPRKLLVVEDATQDERFRDNELVTGELGVRFYAGAPLLDSEGRPLGTLCVLDRVPRALDAAGREILSALARQVSRLLDLRRTNIEFAELAEAHADARRELEQREDRLRFTNEFLEDARHITTIEAVIANGLERLQRRMAGVRVSLERWSDAGEIVVLQCSDDGGRSAAPRATRRPPGAPAVLELLRKGLTVSVNDVTRDPLFVDVVEPTAAWGARSFLRVAVGIETPYDHVLVLECMRPRRWSEHETELMRSAAGRVEVLAERARVAEDRRRTMEALRVSEERWQLALAGNDDGIWDWDLRTDAIYFSPRWKSMLGFEPHELPDVVDTWSSRVHPDDLARTLHDLQEHIEGRTPSYSNEHRVRTKDGTYLWILDRGKVLRDADGRAYRMVGSHTDVTARKHAELALRESETRFRELCNTSPMLVWLSNAAGECEWFNEGWLEFTGRAMLQELGSGWTDGIHPEDRDRCTALWRECNATKREFALEYRLRHSGGGYRWIYVVGRPRFDGQDGFLGFIGGGIDIDARKRLEQDLAVARDGALEAARAKSRFIANMSHELRTPLNGLLGMANLLELSDLAPEPRHFVANLRRSAEQLSSVVEDVLDYASLESGEAVIATEEFDLATLLADVARRAAREAGDRGLAWIGPDLEAVPQRVVGDAKRLRTVLDELVVNALKFTTQGSVRLGVRIVSASSGTPMLAFEVTDTGPGIEADEQLKLFRSFHQVDGSTTRKHGGLGLGLALARKIVERLGGELGVRSAPGAGSTFWFRIPLRRRVEDVGEPMGALPRHVRVGQLPRFQGRVLVVEDNALNQRVAARLLERLGLHVDVADDGVLALEACARERYDLVFMDCHMPQMDGFEATQHLRERDEPGVRLPIVALSATTVSEERQRCLDSGMDGFLSKPFLLPELIVVLERHLRPANEAPDTPANVPAEST